MGDAFVVVGALRMAIELLVKGWSFQVTQKVGIGQRGIKGAEKNGVAGAFWGLERGIRLRKQCGTRWQQESMMGGHLVKAFSSRGGCLMVCMAGDGKEPSR